MFAGPKLSSAIPSPAQPSPCDFQSRAAQLNTAQCSETTNGNAVTVNIFGFYSREGATGMVLCWQVSFRNAHRPDTVRSRMGGICNRKNDLCYNHFENVGNGDEHDGG